MKTTGFLIACLAIFTLFSCEKIDTRGNKVVYTGTAEVTRDYVNLTGTLLPDADKESITETGFLISEKKGFKDKNAKKLTATIPEGKEFTLSATVEDDLDNKRDVKFYYKAYVVQNGKLLAGSERSFLTEAIRVSTFSIDPTMAGIQKGKSLQLTASIEPDNATHKEITWTSENEKVATVSSQGLVKAVARGKTVITATCDGKSVTCDITVKGTIPSGFKDLGLSVYWAEKNLLADAPEEAGEYYRFGYFNTCLEFNPAKNSYIFPDVDPKTNEFGPDADAATQFNHLWRTPSAAEFKELNDNCRKSSETVGGVKVVRFTSKINGESLIFSSETGNMIQNRVVNQPLHADYGPYGFFRTRTAYDYDAYILYVNHKYTTSDVRISSYTSSGIPIRPVSEGE